MAKPKKRTGANSQRPFRVIDLDLSVPEETLPIYCTLFLDVLHFGFHFGDSFSMRRSLDYFLDFLDDLFRVVLAFDKVGNGAELEALFGVGLSGKVGEED